jgi:ribosomal protein L35
MKTNKSYQKRIKLTKNGKIVVRRGGKNHFNAKESRKSQLKGKRSRIFTLPNKPKSRYLVNL